MLAQRRMQKDLEAIQSGLDQLMQDAKELEGTKLEEGLKIAGDSPEQLQKMVSEAQVRLHKVRKQLISASKKVETMIVEHPFTTTSAVFGIGFLLGKLLSLGKGSLKA